MSNPRVAMRHPSTKSTIQAPATAVKIYEASGWEIVPDDSATETPSPAPAPAGKPRTAKEEAK